MASSLLSLPIFVCTDLTCGRYRDNELSMEELRAFFKGDDRVAARYLEDIDEYAATRFELACCFLHVWSAQRERLRGVLLCSCSVCRRQVWLPR